MTYRAIRTARDMARRNVDIGEGLCVLRVGQAMRIPEATGDQDGASDADAEEAWLRCDSRHFLTGDAFRRGTLVRGTWVFCRSNTPGRHGHAAIATGYGRG